MTTRPTAKAGLSLRWSYIIVPVAILLLSIVLAAFFYHLLPNEIAYHFQSDGTPDKWLGRGMTMVWVLVPQLFLTLVAMILVWVISKLFARSRQSGGSQTNPATILPIMGNMVALPQLIACFAMLDIFIYNAYQIHLMPTWLFALIVIVLATVVMGLLLTIIYLRAKRQNIPQAKIKEEKQ